MLACTEQICVPERADLAVEVPVAAKAETGADPRFAEWLRRLPAPLDAAATFSLDERTVRLAIPLPAATPLDDPHVFIGEDKLADYAGNQQFAWKGDMLIVTLPRTKLDPRGADVLTGVLRLNPAGDGIAFTARAGTVPTGGTPLAADAAAPELPSLPLLLLAALAGGLLLNVMPCVFPILSLKALSLAARARARAMPGSRDLPMRRASSPPASGLARCCWRCAQAASRSAGRSSCRSRWWS